MAERKPNRYVRAFGISMIALMCVTLGGMALFRHWEITIGTWVSSLFFVVISTVFMGTIMELGD